MSADEEEIVFLVFQLSVTGSLIMEYQLRIEAGYYIIITFLCLRGSTRSDITDCLTSLQLEIFGSEHHMIVSRELL